MCSNKRALNTSNAPGITTYTQLLDPPDRRLAAELARLPLQSPGVAAYIHADVDRDVPFLQFWMPGDRENCRVLIHAGAVDESRRGSIRLVSPMDHGASRDEQRAHLARIVLVGEDEVRAAIAYAYTRLGLCVEPSSAVVIAAALGGQFLVEDDTVLVITGSNLDPALLDEVLSSSGDTRRPTR